jgi:pimeloyl-ACP methyl ester carboxylesterase
MKQLIIIVFIFLMTTALQAQNWVGNWEGLLTVGDEDILIVFHIKENSTGKLTGTMDSPDQMTYALKIDEVLLNGNEITIIVNAFNAKYIGTWNEARSKIMGDFIAGIKEDLNLKRTEKPNSNRPQEPQGPFPYKTEEVSYINEKANGIKLSGTLTLPVGDGKYPVVVLISGSGPQDRDCLILGHKPFFVLADYLTRNGIAVLRVDDRGVGESEGDFTTATSVDFATDVEAGITFLRGHSNIDINKIGLIGHSEGGFIAPLIASKNKEVNFIVSLAGPADSGDKVLLKQNEDFLRSINIEEPLIDAYLEICSKLYTAIIKDKKCKKKRADFKELIQSDLDKMSDKNKTKLGLDGLPLLDALQPKWMRYFISLQPGKQWRKVKCPVLALNGGKDIQVAAKPNLEVIETSLKKARNKNFKCQNLPNLNHLFQNCKTGYLGEYVQIKETFSPDAMKLILEWIQSI